MLPKLNVAARAKPSSCSAQGEAWHKRSKNGDENTMQEAKRNRNYVALNDNYALIEPIKAELIWSVFYKYWSYITISQYISPS